MDRDARHLLRPVTGKARGDLSAAAGMQRLTLAELSIEPDASAEFRATSGEAFLYILAGRGLLESEQQRLEVSEGDFIALEANESVRLHNSGSIELSYLQGAANS